MSAPGSDGFVKVATVDELSPGSFMEIEIGEDVYVLANVEGAYYAVSAWCPHQGTSLALGALDGPVLRCWAHLWRFDVRTGDPIWPPLAKITRGYNLRTYPVRVDGSDILLSQKPGRGGTN